MNSPNYRLERDLKFISSKLKVLHPKHQTKMSHFKFLTVTWIQDTVILKSWILMYWLQTLVRKIWPDRLYKSKAILYQGLKIWNSLPVSVTCLSNLFSFSMKLQELLLHICSTYSLFNYCVVSQALPHKPSGYLGLLAFYKL